jgi:hypothetical protein
MIKQLFIVRTCGIQYILNKKFNILLQLFVDGLIKEYDFHKITIFIY